MYIWRDQLSECVRDLIIFCLLLIVADYSSEIMLLCPGFLIISIDVDQIFVGVIIVKIRSVFSRFGLLRGILPRVYDLVEFGAVSAQTIRLGLITEVCL
ncbi:hypothetical protein D3C73_745000 [compost metagenome]